MHTRGATVPPGKGSVLGLPGAIRLPELGDRFRRGATIVVTRGLRMTVTRTLLASSCGLAVTRCILHHIVLSQSRLTQASLLCRHAVFGADRNKKRQSLLRRRGKVARRQTVYQQRSWGRDDWGEPAGTLCPSPLVWNADRAQQLCRVAPRRARCRQVWTQVRAILGGVVRGLTCKLNIYFTVRATAPDEIWHICGIEPPISSKACPSRSLRASSTGISGFRTG